MSAERSKVLNMVANGSLSVDEAEQLLDAMSQTGRAVHTDGSIDNEGTSRIPRFLRVVVNSAKGDHVNIRVPLKLISTGIKLQAMMPRSAQEEMEGRGIQLDDFSKMQTDDLIEALSELRMDIEGNNEDVKIFCE